MAIRIGSIVSWNGGGDEPTIGRVTRISPNRPIEVPGSDFTQTPGRDDPAVLMRVVRESDDGLEDTDTYVGRRLSNLTERNQQGVIRKAVAAIKNQFVKTPELHRATIKAVAPGIWVAAYTNNFRDKHNEIISTAAHDRYIARLKAGLVDYPELWLWHTKGTRHGEAMSIERYGHMIIAVGTFDDTPMGRAAEQFYRTAKDIQLSHGFYHPSYDPDENGVYHDINTFEISSLPANTAANPFTSFAYIEEKEQMKESQRAFIQAVFGEEAASKIEESVKSIEQSGDEIRDAGTAYKDFADLTQDEQPANKEASEADVNALGAKFGELFQEIFEAQAYLSEETATVSKALKGLAGKVEAAVNHLNAQTKAFETTLKSLKTEVELAPRSVQDVQPTVTDEEAAKSIEAQQEVEYDPIFGDMKVPKESN